MKSGNLNFLEPSGHSRPVTALLYLCFYLYYVVSYMTNLCVAYQAYTGFKCFANSRQIYGVQPVVLSSLLLVAHSDIHFILFCGNLELQ